MTADYGQFVPAPPPDYMLFFNTNAGVTDTGKYYPLSTTHQNNAGAAGTLADTCVSVMPIAATISKLTLKLPTNATGTGTTVTLYKNNVATTLTVTCATGVTTGQDLTHSITVAEGDEISVKITCDTDAASATFSGVITPT